MTVTMRRVLGLIACIIFALAAFGVSLPVELVPLGLVFLTASVVP